MVGAADVVFVVDAFGAWLVEQLADAGRKKLAEFILGDDQDRALRQAANSAIRTTADEVSPSDSSRAEQVAMVIGQVFSDSRPDALDAGPVMLLEGLYKGITRQLTVLDDASVTGTGQSSSDVLGVTGAVLADKLTTHLIREILTRGSRGGPLTPLAGQLNFELNRLQGQRIEMRSQRVESMLARLTAQFQVQATPEVRSSQDPVPAIATGQIASYLAKVRQLAALTRFEGREAELERIAEFATGGEGYFLLEGARHAGKTTLLAQFVTAHVPRNVDVVSFFISRQTSDADSRTFLAKVVPQLAELVGAPVGVSNEEVFYLRWQEAARVAYSRNRHLLLVVDGLDEDRLQARSIAAILPVEVAGGALENAHVLVSNRDNAPLPQDLHPAHPLCLALPEVLGAHPTNKNYEALARQEIDELLRLGPGARKLLGALTAARGALSVADLVHLTGLADEQVRAFLRDATRSLPQVAQGRYSFDTDFLGQLQSDAALQVDTYRTAIHGWADEWHSRGWRGDHGSHEEVPRYLLEVYPETLGKEPERRARLVSDPGWIAAAIRQLTVDTVLAKLENCVLESPALEGPGAMRAIVRGQASFLRSAPEIDRGQLLRQLCLQAAELGEQKQAGGFLLLLQSYPGLAPLWSSRRPYRALLAEINGHAGWVNAVAIAPAGRVAVGADDGWVWTWDPSTPSVEPWRLGRHDGPVRALAVLADGRIVTGGQDKRVRAWDPNLLNAEPVDLGTHDGAVRAIAVLDADHVVTGGDDWQVRVWPVGAHGDGAYRLGQHSGAIRALAVTTTGLVASGGDDGQVCLWNPMSPGDPVARTQAIDGRIMTVAVAPDSSLIAGGTDGMIYRWQHRFSVSPEGRADALAERHVDQLVEFGSHRNVVRGISVGHDGVTVSAGDDGLLQLWQATPYGTERIELGRHDGPVRTVSAHDNHAVSGGKDQRVRFWDLGEPRLSSWRRRAQAERMSALSVSPDGRTISGGVSRKLWLWDRSPSQEPVVIGQLSSPALAITWLPGRLIVTCDADGRLQVWDRSAASTGDALEIGRHAGAVLYQAGEFLVTAGFDGQVISWDIGGIATRLASAQAGSRRKVLGQHSSPVAAIAPLPGGWIATGGACGDVLRWRPSRPTDEGAALDPLPVRLNALSALPGCLLAGGDDGQLWTWDLDSGRLTALTGHVGRWLTALTACDSYAVSAGTDGRLVIWEQSADGLRMHSEVATNVYALSSCQTADGYRLAAAHTDGGISYWRGTAV